jgi:tRNA U34 2-thiouridine synthase MnmA/TrmU
MRKHECTVLPLLPPSLFPLNTVWELEVRGIGIQELLNTLRSRCETVVNYVRYRPLQELLKQHMPPSRLVQVTAGSYGPGLLKHDTLLFIVGLRGGAPREPHILEVRIRRSPPPVLP